MIKVGPTLSCSLRRQETPSQFIGSQNGEGTEDPEKGCVLMAGAPKGNRNALKHGLYASKAEVVLGEVVSHGPVAVGSPDAGLTPARSSALRSPAFAIQYIEDAIEDIFARMKRAKGEEFTRLANSLSFAVTALMNGHRTIAFLTGGVSPVEDAIKELEALNFDED